mmetsp:Transcript_28182/g.46361  ORF Transcript_28182/g.46361 Transcript_28182/m.46361 type:complete len:243 (-) Transcript_28182:62-790(-)
MQGKKHQYSTEKKYAAVVMREQVNMILSMHRRDTLQFCVITFFTVTHNLVKNLYSFFLFFWCHFDPYLSSNIIFLCQFLWHLWLFCISTSIATHIIRQHLNGDCVLAAVHEFSNLICGGHYFIVTCGPDGFALALTLSHVLLTHDLQRHACLVQHKIHGCDPHTDVTPWIACINHQIIHFLLIELLMVHTHEKYFMNIVRSQLTHLTRNIFLQSTKRFLPINDFATFYKFFFRYVLRKSYHK